MICASATQYAKRTRGRNLGEQARIKGGPINKIMGRLTAIFRVGEHVVNRQVSTNRNLWRPGLIITPGRRVAVTTVDEQECQRRRKLTAEQSRI